MICKGMLYFSIKYTQLIGKKISYTVTNNKNSYIYTQ